MQSAQELMGEIDVIKRKYSPCYVHREKAVREKDLCLIQSQGLVAGVRSTMLKLVERIKCSP